MLGVLNFTGALLGLSLLATLGDVEESPKVWVASDLIGMQVLSESGERLGEVDDIVVHPRGGTSYAVLSFGDWYGVGGKLFAMPWSVLRTVEPDAAVPTAARSLVLPLDRERLAQAPGFDKQHWPTMANADWTADIDTFYAGAANPNASKPEADDAAVRVPAINWRVTKLTGTEVRLPSGDGLGDIREVVIDTDGRVSYVALSVGGFLGIGDKLVAIPWDALEFSLVGRKGDEKRITSAFTKEQLELAPEFKEGKEHRAAMRDPEWILGVYEYFSCPAYWTRAGASEAERVPRS